MPPTKNSGKKISSAKDFKKNKDNNILDLPSGFRCKVKRPGLPQLMADNVLPDMLTPIADEAIRAGQSGKAITADREADIMGELLRKEGGMEAMFDAMSRITAHCVIEPPCVYHRRKVAGDGQGGKDGHIWEVIPDDERDENILYTDEVDVQDQGFIFQFVVGGSRDLTNFRKQIGESMERLDDESGNAKDPG